LLRINEFKPDEIARNLSSKLTPRPVNTGSRPKVSAEGQLLLALAKSEADRLGHKLIGSPHLLLALLNDSVGVAAGLLGKVGIKKDSTAPALQRFGLTLHEMRIKVWTFTEARPVDGAVPAVPAREIREPAQLAGGAPDLEDDEAYPVFLADRGPNYPDWRSFTLGSRRALLAARAAAAEAKRGEIGTQDLLTALGSDPECAAAEIFGRLGLDLKIRSAAPQGSRPVEMVLNQYRLSKEAAEALRFALEDVKRSKFRHVGTEHLLLGLLRQDTGGAAKWLHQRGISYEAVVAEMARVNPG